MLFARVTRQYLAHDGRPQRKETDGNDPENDGGASDPVVPRRWVVQPHVGVLCGGRVFVLNMNMQ